MKEQFDSLVDHLFGSGFSMQEAVEILEKEMICRALDNTGGNRSAASKALGIHRNTLQRKMSEYKLEERPVRRKPLRNVEGSRKRAEAG